MLRRVTRNWLAPPQNRSQGGTWAPSNGLHLCGSGTTGCHGWITDHPLLAVQHGLAVRSWQTPADVPVRLAAHGLVLLDDKGGFAPALGGAA